MKDKKSDIKKHPKSLKTTVSQFLELPEYTVGSARIEVISNREAVVESCRGILEYNTECVRLITPEMTVKFDGKDLSIGCMNGTGAVVTGIIESIAFSTLR